jgi:hypothetical protein
MEPEEQLIHLHPMDPERQLRQEKVMDRLDLAAFLFCILHVLTQLLVEFVQSPSEDGAFVPELGVGFANPLD